MSCGGLNQFLTPNVPGFNGDGAPLDTSTLTAAKTVYLSGKFLGRYTILGSHNGVNYVPIVSFDGGGGPQEIKQDIEATLSSMVVRRNANQTVVINITAQKVCSC